MKYTAQQQQAIESLARYICVDAGAGSGKTRVLVDRIVHLIATEQARLEEIVAITFTEKAALEMKERLRKAFRRNAPKDDPVAFSQWRDLERRVDTAHITTIHAFCSRLLRENALYLGLDPDFGLISDAETALKLGTLDAVMFFSPRTARIFGALTDASPTERLTAFCISPATAQTLTPSRFARIAVAARPNQDSMACR